MRASSATSTRIAIPPIRSGHIDIEVTLEPGQADVPHRHVLRHEAPRCVKREG
jgi:hypothetical protein